MKRIALTMAVMAMATWACFSQPKSIPGARTIPETLSKGVSAVVRTDSTVTRCISEKAMTTRNIFMVTVLNSEGADFAHFVTHTKKGSSLTRFSAAIYDANGERKRTFGKSEITSSGLSADMADDYTTHYLEFRYPTYPYTVYYEYEISFTDGFISIPSFTPAFYTGASVEKASYTLITPREYGFSYKAVNTAIEPQVSEAKGEKVSYWKMEGIRPYRSDAYMPPTKSVVPHIYFTPDSFIYHRTSGKATSWEEYGKWQWSLMEGRDVLPPELKTIVHSITDTIPTRREKIKALYEYLGKTTRYVSIQLGLGGLQPMSAEEVFRNGFGDCKGLSNYLKAMLKECGIESNYVEISTKSPVIHPNFASVLQTNHVILKVPDEEGDLWLECTNTNIPFGFIHEDIAGHNAVVYANGTASIETVPNYPDSSNRIISDVTAHIDFMGKSVIRVRERYINQCAEGLIGISDAKLSDQKDLIMHQLSIPSCTLDSVSIKEHREKTPVVEISYVCTSPAFAQSSSGRLFVPQSIFGSSTPKFNRTRELDIFRQSGHIWEQNMTITLSTPHTLEGNIPQTEISCCIGSYSHSGKMEGNTISIKSEKRYLSGLQPKEKISEVKNFFTIMSGAAEKKIILRKE